MNMGACHRCERLHRVQSSFACFIMLTLYIDLHEVRTNSKDTAEQ